MSHPKCTRFEAVFLTDSDTEVQRHWLNNHRYDVSPQSYSVASYGFVSNQLLYIYVMGIYLTSNIPMNIFEL